VKKSGRDEPIWVVTHICIEITQGISCISNQQENCFFLYISNQQGNCFFSLNIFYGFSSTKLENKRAEHVLPGGGCRGEVAQIMYTYVSKCKNDKIKK
jgi:hypothetical protein